LKKTESLLQLLISLEGPWVKTHAEGDLFWSSRVPPCKCRDRRYKSFLSQTFQLFTNP